MSAESIVSEVLKKRGITDADRFLHPDFARDTHDPFLLPDMDIAARMLATAITQKKKVVVFGDYDADGLPATALLVRVLQSHGVPVVGMIPTRSQGYGLTLAAVEGIRQTGAELVIAVDNGTVATEEVTALTALGIPTIICDHHEPGEHEVAKAVALINPKLTGSSYPFRELCGAALAWKLLVATYQQLGFDTASLKWELDLVGLATVADMVPLVGENRVLAKFGLTVLAKTRNSGLKALAAVSGVDLDTVSTRDIGFGLAPRLNAASRTHKEEVDGVNVPLRLLVGGSEPQEITDANHLNECNSERQNILQTQMDEAKLQALTQLSEPCLVVYAPHWSSGVIGLIAGRLAELYSRPVVALADEGRQTKGSVRSVADVDAVKWVAEAQSVLERFGGHAKAGGLTLISQGDGAVSQLRELLVKALHEEQQTIEGLAIACKKQADVCVKPEELTEELARKLATLEPFGVGFEKPIVSAEMKVKRHHSVGKQGQHLSLLLESDDSAQTLKAIAFNRTDTGLSVGSHVTVLLELEMQTWNGKESVNAIVRRLEVL